MRGLVRDVGLTRRWPVAGAARVAGWLASLPQPVIAFLIARLAYTVLAAWGVTSIVLAAEKPAGSFPAIRLTGWAALLIEPWTRWDGLWYLKIVEQGYGLERYLVDGREVITQASTAFFPLYPALVWLLSRLPAISPPLAGGIVSSVGTLIGVIVLHRLVTEEFGPTIADRTIRYLLIFPTAFFFFAVYTEGIYLCLSVLAIWNSRRGNWWQAGVWGGLAAGARVSGLLLVIPILFDYVAWLRANKRRPGWEIPRLSLLPGGLIVYLIYLSQRFGNPTAFLDAQRNVLWQREPASLFQIIRYVIESVDVFTMGLPEPQRITEDIRLDLFYGGYHEFNGINLLFFVGALIVLGLAYRRVPWGWFLYTSAMIFLPLNAPVPSVPLQSVPRYLLPIFPLFVTLAIVARRPLLDRLIVYPWLALGGIFVVRFATWYWVA